MATTLAVLRDDVRRARILASAPVAPSGAGARAVLRVDGFALTSNNITYGTTLAHWGYFPLQEAGWGCIPAWGHATVVSSDVEGVAVGSRYFGYVPMASEFTALPTNVAASSFLDGAEHRPTAIPIYNTYNSPTADPLYAPDRAPELMFFRPLYMTPFVLADFLADNAFFGAAQVVLSSASSRTSYGTAYALRNHGGARLVGLTSQRNRDFVSGLGIYDHVLVYGDEGCLPRERTAYVDVAGNPGLRSALRQTLRDALVYDCPVGGTHWEARAAAEASIDDGTGAAAPTPFLAAAHLGKRIAEWGRAGFQQNFAASVREFIARAMDPARPWIRFVAANSDGEVLRAYDEVVSGRAAPDTCYVLKL